MTGPAHTNTGNAGYQALTTSAGLVDLTGRTQLELIGPDRASFLHNFCTNAVRNLPPGAGTEAFFTDVKGRILGHGFIFNGPQSLVIETVPDQGQKLAQHLDRYLIREQVEIHDRSQEWSEILLAGPKAPEVLIAAGLQVPFALLGHSSSDVDGTIVSIRRVDIAGPVGFLLSLDRDRARWFQDRLLAAGASLASGDDFNVVRIESGFPLYGIEITSDNLPQEIHRDQRTISFTKGCYLGQETVARLDALGHVNKLLKGVRFSTNTPPPPGASLLREGHAVGTVLSAVFSPRFSSAIALAMVRRGHHEAGSRLESDFGSAEVVELPFS